MLQLLKLSFKRTNDSIFLSAVLIVFISIISCYLLFAIPAVDNLYKFGTSIITFVALLAALLSSFFYLVKKSILLSNKSYLFEVDRFYDIKKLFLSIPKGFNLLFLPMIEVVGVVLFIYFIGLMIIKYFITKYVGFIDFDCFGIQTIFNPVDLFQQIKILSNNELQVILVWFISAELLLNSVGFLVMFWVPEIVYFSNNAFKALFYSLQKIFKSFLKNFGFFLILAILLHIVFLLNICFLANRLTFILDLIISYYLLVFIVVLLFTYYGRKYIESAE